MTEEIKEIIEHIKTYPEKMYCLSEKEKVIMLDYITNLQQENEKLKYNARGQANDYFKDKYADEVLKNAELTKENERLKEENILLKASEPMSKIAEDYGYKSRCKKAIEYISFVINHYKEQLKTPIEDTYFDSDVNRKGYILSIIAYLQTTLDTLIGSDENE